MSKTYKCHGHKNAFAKWNESKAKAKRSSARSKTKIKLTRAADADAVVFPDDKSSGAWNRVHGGHYLSPISSEEEFLSEILSMREGIFNGAFIENSRFNWQLDFRNAALTEGIHSLSQFLCELSIQDIRDFVHRHYVCKGGIKRAQYSISKRRSGR